MRSSIIITRISKYLVILILIGSFILALYWLWQRQPKALNLQTPQTTTTQTQKPKEEWSPDLKPVDSSVLTTESVKLEGKSIPNSLVAIFSNEIATIASSDNSGNFEKEVILAKGLNLIDLVVISRNFSQKDQRSLTYFVTDNDKNGKTVYTGTVKTIFDTLLTISTKNGEKNIQASPSTVINLPPPPNGEKEVIGSPLKNIRIGDYLIVVGDLLQDAQNEKLQAKKIEVIRDNLPQNTKKMTLAKTLSIVRQNLFSAKNTTNNQILEFTLSKNSQISLDGKEAKSTDIVKDKNAIVIYHVENNKNIVDLIYLLP